MIASQNGYSANDRTQITTYTVTKSGRTMQLRKGSPGQLLAHMVWWFDENIRDIDPGIMDDWSYAERPIRGSDVISNHASGTAADVDATKWPLGVNPEAYLSKIEIARVREQLKVYEGCIRWGGDYSGRKDPMHFEINKPLLTCDRVWEKLSAQGGSAATPTGGFLMALTDKEQDELLAKVRTLHRLHTDDSPGVDRIGNLSEQIEAVKKDTAWIKDGVDRLVTLIRPAVTGAANAGQDAFTWVVNQIKGAAK